MLSEFTCVARQIVGQFDFLFLFTLDLMSIHARLSLVKLFHQYYVLDSYFSQFIKPTSFIHLQLRLL